MCDHATTVTERPREHPPTRRFVLTILLGPLATPAALLLVAVTLRRLVYGDWLEPGWALLLLLGPSLPLYLLILPLLRMVILRVRRRGAPSTVAILVPIVGVQVAIDLALWAGVG